MIVFKVIFWIYVVGLLGRMVDCTKDHPRIETTRLEVDLLGLIIQIGLTIWIGISIW